MMIANTFRRWLDGDDAAEEVVRGLADADETTWRELRLHLCAGTTQRLISLAHEALSRDPNRAVWLSRLAIRISDDAAAWREYAAALLESGEYVPAQEAAQRARALYDPSAQHDLAVLGAIEGRILHELGDSLRGLRLLDESARTLLRLNDKKTYVRARSIYAAVLLNLGRYRESAETYAAMADLAQQEGDTETLAHAVLMIGRCAVKLGDVGRARQCFETALEMFEQLGLAAEPPRVRKGIAEILLAQGRVAEAISELYKARAEFLALQLPVVAALVSLDIIDLLRSAGRTSEIEYLVDAAPEHLPPNAGEAFAILRQRATEEDVRRVRGYLERLPMEA